MNDKKQVLTRHTFVIIDGARLYEQIDRIGERRYSLSRAVCHVGRCLAFAADYHNVRPFTNKVLDHFIIAITGDSTPGSAAKIIRLGAEVCLSKPLVKVELLAAVGL